MEVIIVGGGFCAAAAFWIGGAVMMGYSVANISVSTNNIQLLMFNRFENTLKDLQTPFFNEIYAVQPN